MSLNQENFTSSGQHSSVEPVSRPLNPAPGEVLTAGQTQHIEYRCSVCGRQDHTLRFAAYPYVISLLVITFRRAFVGLWCRKHANLRLVAASLISGSIGWLGIPFGFIFTPAALYNLARGGMPMDEQNSKMLQQVAADKASQGDRAEWKRCLEESLKYQANSASRQELFQITSLQTAPEPPGFWKHLGSGLGVLLIALCMGALVGILSFLLGLLFGSVFQNGSSIFLVIFSWTSYFALAFLAGILLSQVLEAHFTRLQAKNIPGVVLFSLLATVLMVYSIVHSMDFAGYLYALKLGVFASSSEAYYYAFYHLIFGAVNYIGWAIDSLTTLDIIDLAVLGVILICDCLIGIRAALKIVRWQKALVESAPAQATAWKLI